MIYSHRFNGVSAKTGDILFTRDGQEGSVFGEIWKLLGHALPGDFDHCAMYLGPGVRFVESAAKGVVVVQFAGDDWDAIPYGEERLLVDELIGVGDAIAGRGFTPEQENEIRENVVAYCLRQAAESKPYNLDFFNPDTDGAFYCSQLVYKAYKDQGIDLDPREENQELLQAIVFPADLWKTCRARERV